MIFRDRRGKSIHSTLNTTQKILVNQDLLYISGFQLVDCNDSLQPQSKQLQHDAFCKVIYLKNHFCLKQK